MNGFNGKFLTILTALVLLAGCGGGGSTITGGVSTGTNGTPASTIISGVAAKGILYPGKVSIYKIKSDGSKDTTFGGLLASGIPTNSRGEYIVNLGTYTGPVLVEASGDYTDEATGETKSIPETDPLRAALANATGTVNVSVTPLTEV